MPFKPKLKKQLIDILGANWVRDDAVTLYSYRCDGLTLHTAPPTGVVFPADKEELAKVVTCLGRADEPFLPRGAGTGLSGGAVPNQGGVIVEMCRLNQIHHIDPLNRIAKVGPGVVNIAVSQAARAHGLHFVPDPSSQKACTVGGNVAENSGGPHTLKYGVTVNHVLGIEVVLADGSIHYLGGDVWGTPGPDLLAAFIGSEGTFGIVTEITCRLTPIAEKVATLLAVFPSVRNACEAVSAIIRGGIVPAAMEMIDKTIIGAVEKTIHAGLPLEAEALLIIELEDLADGLQEEADRIRRLLAEHKAVDIRLAADEAERTLIWRARKEAFGAVGTLSPSFYTQDGVIPRSSLPFILDRVAEIGREFGLRVANVFHAGDGNLHPLILYDSLNPAEVEAVHLAGKAILQTCLKAGGTLSGEHGIGLEKAEMMSELYREQDLQAMMRIRDVFNPRGLLNPGKIFPTPGRCSEVKMVPSKSGVRV